MSSKETITFKRVVTYDMPEYNWDDAQAWYDELTKNLKGLNSLGQSKSIVLDSTYANTKKETLAALQSRIDNKTATEGDFGYGKCMKSIIGEYKITLEDKVGLEKKISIMQKMLDYFNSDEKLINFDPLDKGEETKKEFENMELDKIVELSMNVVTVEMIDNLDRLSAGQVLGYISRNFPYMKTEMKNIAPLVAKSLEGVKAEVIEIGPEKVKEEILIDYPNAFEKGKKGPKKRDEPIFYVFRNNELEPTMVYYEVDEEVKEIPLATMIKKMKHDKEAYTWLNQHKPNGGPYWPSGGSGNFYLVISNDPFMNHTKSSGRFWEGRSCERYNSYDWKYAQGPISDIKFGNCVVFAFKGDKLPEGWPYKQPTNREFQKIENVDDGALLGRQNIKWGYKENKKGDIGMGLDPAFYPRSGNQAWTKLLNRALAMIIASQGYFNYDLVQTPYYYIGHCDVGSGTGTLYYKAGNTCFTKMEGQQVNPDLIAAGNEMINYVAFDRLTRPIIEDNIKMILAQNPNIWAIAGNETGIGRLIKTKNLEIIRFLVASPDADAEALSAIIDLIPEIDPEWLNPFSYSSLPYLIAKHPNSNQKIYNKLLKMHPGYVIDGKKYFAIEILFGGMAYYLKNPSVGKPYICYADDKTISKLITKSKKKGMHPILKSLLFAPKISIENYQKVLEIISSDSKKLALLESRLLLDAILSFMLPISYKDSWAFNNNALDYTITVSELRLFNNIVERQNLETLKQILLIAKEYPQLNNQIFVNMVQCMRFKEGYQYLWRKRKQLEIPSYLFTQYTHSPMELGKPMEKRFFESKNFMATYRDGELSDCRYEWNYKDNKILRTNYPPAFITQVVSNEENIQNLGWGLVALWLNDEENHFKPYLELVYKKAFTNLYKGNGKFIKPPKDIFELYNSIQDISILQEAVIDSVYNEGGLARNNNLPLKMQQIILDVMPKLSDDYGGSYEEYYFDVLKALSKNLNTSSKILDSFKDIDELKPLIANNPNTSTKTLLKLYDEYPTAVLTNTGLVKTAYNKLWNKTFKIITTPVSQNPNRLFGDFRINSVMERYKGSQIRNEMLNFIGKNKYVRFWKAGNVKKGKFSQYQKQNLYTEPIADYPIIPNKKCIVAKFYDDIDSYQGNEVYYLDKCEELENGGLFIEGVCHKWVENSEKNTRVEEKISQNVIAKEFFNFIPESERSEIITSTNEAGEIESQGGERWEIDNIIVLTDVTNYDALKILPQWRFDLNQEKIDEIILSYVSRGDNLQKLIDILETPFNSADYNLNSHTVFKAIDKYNKWNRNLINRNLSTLMRSNGAEFRKMENMPLTEKILNMCLLQSDKELADMGLADITLNDLPKIQEHILKNKNPPIKFLYYVLMSSNNPLVIQAGKTMRKNNSQAFIDLYRELNPPPTRKG